jgi:hypothetical protein
LKLSVSEGCEEIELHPHRLGPALGQILDDLSRSGIRVSIETMQGDAGYVFFLGEAGKSKGSLRASTISPSRSATMRLNTSPTASLPSNTGAASSDARPARLGRQRRAFSTAAARR